MAIDANTIVSDVEGALVNALSSRAVSYLVSLLPSWLGFMSGPISWIIGLIVSRLVTWGDWATYYLGDEWEVSADANKYQAAGEALSHLPPTATPQEIQDAQKAKQDAFDALMGAS